MSDDRNPPSLDDRTSERLVDQRGQDGDGILATIKTTYRKFVRPFARDDEQVQTDTSRSNPGDDPSRG